MVREKAVSAAERAPSAAGVSWWWRACDGCWEGSVWAEKLGEERAARSLRIEVLCLRAELKAVFCA